ncbi:IS5/IS1182 family transposase [Streptomyces sp. MNU76]|uniref:transposase family protein n=1 Tax=Streptomyces sp. MNU76 TaxID=2560026 RepID=UPI001E4C3CE1|nr:transposase family protein [Streptomyces sp. MNU76]MCC9705516.1 IS5/IS1182 family transposase [Streptomyces sp. MNU76]
MRKNTSPAEGTEGLVYQCRLPLSSSTLDLVAGLVRSHLKKIRSRWRKLPPGRIALIVLAVLRHDQRLSDIAGGNDVSASTVRRWLLEVIGLLSARAQRLDRALKKIARKGGVVVLLDGTLVRTRRRTGDENRPNYSGKHKAHGPLFLALTDETGNLVWISAAKPGRSSEITTARHNRITTRLREAGLGALADLGFVPGRSPLLRDDSGEPGDLRSCKGPWGMRVRRLSTCTARSAATPSSTAPWPILTAPTSTMPATPSCSR